MPLRTCWSCLRSAISSSAVEKSWPASLQVVAGRRAAGVVMVEKSAVWRLLAFQAKCFSLRWRANSGQKLLSQYSDGSSSLEVMVVISHELIYKRMFDPSDAVRREDWTSLRH